MVKFLIVLQNIHNFIQSMLKWINENIAKSKPTKDESNRQLNSDPEILPGNLAGRILDYEYLFQTEAVSKEMIANLTCLYIEAVEYYQSRSNEKYKLYHKRMELFLKKKAVDDILRGKSGELVSKRESAEKTIIHARNKSKSEVDKIISQTQKRAHKNRNLINKNIEEQNQKLESRIHVRKTMSNRSVYSDKDDDFPEEGEGRQKESFSFMLQELNSGRGVGAKRVFI